jgi:ABC-type bacteriocin/lantibiotic exporter with double-glycine peptidase domain
LWIPARGHQQAPRRTGEALTPLLEHARPQWNTYTCGPAALRCALLCYGERVDGRKLAELANTDPGEGTDVEGLKAAADIFGLKISQWVSREQGDAAVTLRRLLEEGAPVLLATEQWEHWVCALPRGRGIRLTNRNVWVADPARDGDSVVRRTTWRKILRRAQWGLPDEVVWHMYAVEP